VAPKPPAGDTPRTPAKKKRTFVGSTSNQPAADQSMDDKKKGAQTRKFWWTPNDTDKKLHLSTKLDDK
jgi:hypothetical protein